MSAERAQSTGTGATAAQWMARARAWLDELQTPTGLHASSREGVYDAVYGRDTLWSILLVLEAARLRPADVDLSRWAFELAERSLRALAATQGTRQNDVNEEQPGKICHEYWPDPPARLVQAGFPLYEGRYYGSADATYLYLIAAVTLWQHVAGGRELVTSLWDSMLAALRWTLDYGDVDGDALVEVAPRQPEGRGLKNQVWKDSSESAVLEDGTWPPPNPAAWIELQGYAIAAYRGMRELLRERGEEGALQMELAHRAGQIQQQLDRFWLPDAGCHAMLLTPNKRPVPLVSSNVGHLLWCGALEGVRAAQTAERLLQPDLLSTWGLRTLASDSYAFDPTSYHRGSIWPFDNAITASALWRMGRHEDARTIGRRVIAALERFGTPVELYCSLPAEWVRDPDTKGDDVLFDYRAACRVQAWSAAGLLLFGAQLEAGA